MVLLVVLLVGVLMVAGEGRGRELGVGGRTTRDPFLVGEEAMRGVAKEKKKCEGKQTKRNQKKKSNNRTEE